MKYKSFRIQNFKGIKDTTVQFQSIAGANVFAFVGLNESGKTTVLEAIHSFSPEQATGVLLGGTEGLGVPMRERVPRHLLSEFTGQVSVTATILASQDDKELVAQELKDEHGLEIQISDLPDELVIERRGKFQDGDYKSFSSELLTQVYVKTKKQKKWRTPTASERKLVKTAIYNMAPDIAYFPTFVFDFPKSIFLTDRGGAVDGFYRRVFQDILDYDGRDVTIEKDIVRRVRREGMVIPWLQFLSSWGAHDDRDKIQHVMDRAGAVVTRVIFGRWNTIFGEDTRGKEIVISFELVEGEVEDEQGTKTLTDEHDVKIKFKIRDGTRRFDVNDRSLGFRWFFSFMLFTQFRIARYKYKARPLLFLFDEPASNLHAAAQQKLIESFPEIGQGENVLAYSTHSHYMIEPKWLEQTFIVTNRSDNPTASLLDEISLDDESLDVQVATYRSFVNDHPGQTSYFQPILDRLEVVPSRFDIQRSSIIVEGKSDYFVLRYAQQLHGLDEMPLMPGLGAGTFGALAAMHVGWNLNFLFVLDGDQQGKAEQNRYAADFGIPAARLVTIDELVSGVSVIEDLLDNEARDVIKSALALSGAATKNQIRRFFQERLASGNAESLGAGFATSSKAMLDQLNARLASANK